MRERAVALGWPIERIRTIDSDLAGLGQGVADWGLDMLLQPAARTTVRALAGRLDRPSTSPDRGHPRVRGVHRVDHELRLGPDSLVQDLDAARDPFLVLLHGPHTTSGVINLISTPIPVSAQGQLKAELASFDTRTLHAHDGAHPAAGGGKTARAARCRAR